MVTVYDVPADRLISKASEELKSKIKMPEWAKFVKTGTSRERPPDKPDWYFTRAASVLRKIYTDGPVGIERLRTVYGGKKNFGSRPSHTRKAGGKVLRTVLQQLEGIKLVEKAPKGRKLTAGGQKFLDEIANSLKG